VIDVGLIPARGGSVGVPGKNTRLLAGIPLIGWTIAAALDSGVFKRVVVTTDDPEIAIAALDWRAEVPFLRPSELATETASTADVVAHAIEALALDGSFALLQPTSPFRDAEHLRCAASLFASRSPSALVGVAETKPAAWLYAVGEGHRLNAALPGNVQRRQDAPKMVCPNGSMYFTDVARFSAARTLLPDGAMAFEMGRIASLDIDEPVDFELAEAIVAFGMVRPPR
jgi:CMP-N-acetylneuraminic acid synthetase